MIAFCTTCKGRAQHLKVTLPKNLADNADFADCKFVIVDYSLTDDVSSYVYWTFRKEIASGRVVLYHAPAQERFRMAHAKNMAHRLGMVEGADILVNLDADNFTGSGFARYVAERFAQNSNCFLWAYVTKTDGSQRGISGRVAVSAKAFFLAGGYDEKYVTWAPDDKDFNARLRRIGFERSAIPEEFLGVVLHSDKMRFKEYPEARSTADSGSPGVIDPGNTIVNFGVFGCGIAYRNFDPRPIELKPVPTRIFGIGMHKTATTSLYHALGILGYDSAHWKSAHWAKAIWREMRRFGKSPTLERNYALCNLPITLLFRELDAAYPGSKFILTTREENGWAETVEKHWRAEINPYRAGWDTDAFSHRVHKILYGRTDFDRETMLARYRRHNQEVLEYFRYRREDLLVMDMNLGWPLEGPAQWYPLCGFLDKPIPKVPYPRSFASY